MYSWVSDVGHVGEARVALLHVVSDVAAEDPVLDVVQRVREEPDGVPSPLEKRSPCQDGGGRAVDDLAVDAEDVVDVDKERSAGGRVERGKIDALEVCHVRLKLGKRRRCNQPCAIQRPSIVAQKHPVESGDPLPQHPSNSRRISVFGNIERRHVEVPFGIVHDEP